MAGTDGLSLYQYMGCAFCARVRAAMARMELDIELRDTQLEPERMEELLIATGRGTVPVLRIEEGSGEISWLRESADIIHYLEERFDGGGR